MVTAIILCLPGLSRGHVLCPLPPAQGAPQCPPDAIAVLWQGWAEGFSLLPDDLRSSLEGSVSRTAFSDAQV